MLAMQLLYNLELLALGKVETVKKEVIIRAAWLKCYRKATKIRNLFISKWVSEFSKITKKHFIFLKFLPYVFLYETWVPCSGWIFEKTQTKILRPKTLLEKIFARNYTQNLKSQTLKNSDGKFQPKVKISNLLLIDSFKF